MKRFLLGALVGAALTVLSAVGVILMDKDMPDPAS